MRHPVLRVQTSGLQVLLAPPNGFATEGGTGALIAELEARQFITHHTHLEVLRYSGDRCRAFERAGVRC